MHNCTVRNDTEGAVDVRCEPGYDGGLSQTFVLEVYAANLNADGDGDGGGGGGRMLYRNLTDRTAPRFALGRVKPGVMYTARMYAVNSKGRATPVVLPGFSFPGSENQTGKSGRTAPTLHGKPFESSLDRLDRKHTDPYTPTIHDSFGRMRPTFSSIGNITVSFDDSISSVRPKSCV